MSPGQRSFTATHTYPNNNTGDAREFQLTVFVYDETESSDSENLSDAFIATGRDVDGGYAEYMRVPEDYACHIPDALSDTEAAPLLCAGAIGYRALRLCGIKDGDVLGLTGFGGSGHIVLQLARHQFPKSPVFVFARSASERELAMELGAAWSGSTADAPPRPCRSIIDTTPAWLPVLKAMENLQPGGRLVINAIRKSPADRQLMAEINYEQHLWQEKEIKSVANICFSDIEEFLPLAASIPIRPTVETFDFERANDAVLSLHDGNVRGAKVLLI